MEFTEDGLNLANSLKFAQSVHDYLSPWREQGLSDSKITKLLPGIVAWAATGHSISHPPVGAQSYELTAFVLHYPTEVDDLCNTVIQNIVSTLSPA
jgi:hypothetical protein